MKRKAKTSRQVIRFIQRNLRHAEGDLAGQPFLLLDWQKDVIRDIYDDIDPATGWRRVTQYYLETGKGNGKSPFLAAIGIVEMLFSGPGALVITAAATFAQASETVFKPAQELIRSSPTLSRICVVQEKGIKSKGGRRWIVFTSDGKKGKAGYRPTCAILDELQEQTNRALLDSIEANQVKLSKRQPLLLLAGNAGEPETVAEEWYEKGQRYMAGDRTEDLAGFKSRIFGIKPDDNWKDRKLWHLANPALGRIITMEALEKEFQKALKNRAVERRFRQLHLGQWMTTTLTGFLDMEAWKRACGKLPPDSVLNTYASWLSFDLSALDDITAKAQLWAGPDRKIYGRVKLWIPETTALRYEADHEIPYTEWAKQGAITLVEPLTIDHTVKAAVGQDIITSARAAKEFRQVCYDSYRASELVQLLEREGKLTCEPVKPTFEGLGEATKELAARLTAGTILFEDNPCLTFMARNLHVYSNTMGDVRPCKKNAKGKYAGKVQMKIDGLTAIILGLARAMRYANALVPEAKPAAAAGVWED